VKGNVKGMFIILLDIKVIIHEELVLAGKTVNFAYYWDVLWRPRENGQDFDLNFGV
jgi:hypothetical protein